MKTYYTVENGKITQSADWKFSHEALETDRGIIRGWDGGLYFAGEEPSDPGPSATEILAAAEAKRNSLLSETDWYVIRASEPDGKPVPDDILAYRQALRDLDSQPGWPENVNWPVLSE